MDTSSLLNKPKLKAEENNSFVENTSENQKKLINDIQNFNHKLNHYIEKDVISKNSLKEGQDKLFEIKKRIESCKVKVLVVKDKLERINTKLANKL